MNPARPDLSTSALLDGSAPVWARVLAALLAQISLIDLVPTLPAATEPAAKLLLLPPEAAMA